MLIINELSHINKQEFAENLADNATKVPQGLFVVATNAGFSGTWQYKWRELARTSERWHFSKIDYPSPWLDTEEIAEAAIRNSNSRFQRLWYGVWASGAGDAIDQEDITAAVDRDLLPMLRIEAGYGFVAGLDLGIKHDHSALVALARNGNTQRIRLAECQSWKPDRMTGKVDLEAVEAAILNAHKRFHFAAVYYDPYQAALMAQRLSRKGVTMREFPFTGKNCNLMASTLLEVFRSRQIDLYDHPRLIADLSRLTIVEKSYGYKLEATRDANGHADTATALAICLPAAKFISNSGGSWKPIIAQQTSSRFPGKGKTWSAGHGQRGPLRIGPILPHQL